MAFEMFTRDRVKSSNRDTPTVRVVSGGSHMVFNAAAIRLVGEEQAFCLLFDPETATAALQPAEEEDPNSYKLHRSPSTGQINIRAFIKQNDIPVAKPFTLELHDGLFTFETKAA